MSKGFIEKLVEVLQVPFSNSGRRLCCLVDAKWHCLPNHRPRPLLPSPPPQVLPPLQVLLLRPPSSPSPIQLNMYGFHKLTRRKSEMIFQNEFFTRDNPDWQLIQRKGKAASKEEADNEISLKIREEVSQLKEKDAFLAELLEKLSIFKEKNGRTVSKLKLDLEKLTKMVSSKKGRAVKNYVAEIKEKLRGISQVEKKVDSAINSSIATENHKLEHLGKTCLESKKEDGKEEFNDEKLPSKFLAEYGSISHFLN